MPFLRRVDRGVAEPIDVAQPDAAGGQRFARTDHDAARGGVEPHDIKRRTGRDAEPAPLPDGEMNDAVVMAEHAAVEAADLARSARSRCPGCPACRRRQAQSGAPTRGSPPWCGRRAESATGRAARASWR